MMNICPHCQTRYTDETLRFCLQDGHALEKLDEGRTLVLDEDALASAETIETDRSGVMPGPGGGYEEPGAAGRTRENVYRETGRGDATRVTVVSPGRGAPEPSDPGTGGATRRRGGPGFFAGLAIGIVLLLFGAVSIAALFYLPSLFGDQRTATNRPEEKTPEPEKERVLTAADGVRVTASTARKTEKGNSYQAGLAFDGNSRTAWAEGVKGPGRGQWIVFDFPEEVELRAIRIEPGYFKTGELWRKNNRVKAVRLTFSDGSTRSYGFADRMVEQKVDLGGVRTRSVMFTIRDIYPGQADTEDTLISEVSFVVE